MKYKFIGQPDKKFPDLVHGAVYDLTVETLNTGLMRTTTRPVIINPIYCPYSSWETFYQNWEPQAEKTDI